MNFPKLSKPGFYGAVVGAALLAVNGFSWGGWVTGSKAQEMATEAAVAALLPICIEQSNRDPQFADQIRQLKNAQSYMRPDMVMKTGWSTMPGASEPNRGVASACGEHLVAKF
jgi:flavin-dependent dehydrogenase